MFHAIWSVHHDCTHRAPSQWRCPPAPHPPLARGCKWRCPLHHRLITPAEHPLLCRIKLRIYTVSRDSYTPRTCNDRVYSGKNDCTMCDWTLRVFTALWNPQCDAQITCHVSSPKYALREMIPIQESSRRLKRWRTHYNTWCYVDSPHFRGSV